MEITASVANIRYRGDGGWTVIDFVDETNLRFVGVGIMPAVYEGEKLVLEGDWTVHRVYGKQFNVKRYRTVPITGTEAVLKYLSSGLVKGVGLATAKAIVDEFGERALEVIEKEPSKLERISGIGVKRSRMIHDSYMEKRGTQEIFMGLGELGFTLNQSMRIFKLYGEECVKKIRENPYRLIADVDSIGFKTADKIARNAGIEEDSPFRIGAGIRHVLNEARLDGSTCLPRETLTEQASSMLGVELVPVENRLEELIIDGTLVEKELNGGTYVFLSWLHFQEMDSAVCLFDIMQNAKVLPMTDIDGDIKVLEGKLGTELDVKQYKAVRDAFLNGVLVITGGPGTGKTTILKFIIELMESMRLTYELAAPTGRAAKRISDTTGREARTIHRLLEYGGAEDDAFAKNADNPIEADVVIIDEMSMVDISLFHNLLKAIDSGTRLIMVGDFDQLPSVGPGDVLRDIILSEVVPVIRLTEIYRQAGRSMIVINAHRINHGLAPVVDKNESDFIFISKPDLLLARDSLLSLCVTLKEKNVDDFQVLAPMKQNVLGVNELNIELQKKLNPNSPEKAELKYGDTVFRVGDRVMQTRNNYELQWTRWRGGEEGEGVFNGDIGTVMSVNRANSIMSVLFDDERLAEYGQAELEDIELAYAISIHKSQGSEFSTVILPLVSGPPMLMSRNILYTAVTRARDRVVIIGSAECVKRMARNTLSMQRHTALKAFLCQLAEGFDS